MLKNLEVFKDVVRNCHEGSLPNDCIYDVVDSLITRMSESSLESMNDWECEYDLEVNYFREHPFYEHYLDLVLQHEQVNSFSALKSQAEFRMLEELQQILVNELTELEGVEYECE